MLHGLIRRQESLNLSEVALFDDDPARLATMGAFARAFSEWQGARFTISHSHDLAEAARDNGGKVVVAAALARAYGVTDIDGRRPDPLDVTRV